MRAMPASGTIQTMDPISQLVTLQDRKRANLARIARFDHYLVHEEPDGTLIWEPAVVMSVTEQRLLEDRELMASIEASRRDTSSLVTRDRSGSPRED